MAPHFRCCNTKSIFLSPQRIYTTYAAFSMDQRTVEYIIYSTGSRKGSNSICCIIKTKTSVKGVICLEFYMAESLGDQQNLYLPWEWKVRYKTPPPSPPHPRIFLM